MNTRMRVLNYFSPGLKLVKSGAGLKLVKSGESSRPRPGTPPELIQGPGVLPNRGTSLYIRDIRKLGCRK